MKRDEDESCCFSSPPLANRRETCGGGGGECWGAHKNSSAVSLSTLPLHTFSSFSPRVPDLVPLGTGSGPLAADCRFLARLKPRNSTHSVMIYTALLYMNTRASLPPAPNGLLQQSLSPRSALPLRLFKAKV